MLTHLGLVWLFAIIILAVAGVLHIGKDIIHHLLLIFGLAIAAVAIFPARLAIPVGVNDAGKSTDLTELQLNGQQLTATVKPIIPGWLTLILIIAMVIIGCFLTFRRHTARKRRAEQDVAMSMADDDDDDGYDDEPRRRRRK